MSLLLKLCFAVLCLLAVVLPSFVNLPLSYYLKLSQVETKCLLLNKSYSYQNVSDAYASQSESQVASCGPALNLVLNYEVYLPEYDRNTTICGQDIMNISCISNSKNIETVKFYNIKCPPLVAFDFVDYNNRNISDIFKCWILKNKDSVVWRAEYIPYIMFILLFVIIGIWCLGVLCVIIMEIKKKKYKLLKVVPNKDNDININNKIEFDSIGTGENSDEELEDKEIHN